MKKIKLLHIFYVIYICLLHYSGMFCMDSGYGESAYDRGLLCIPKDIVYSIIHSFQDIKNPISVEKLTEGVKGLIQFRSTCKEIYTLLPDKKIRELCESCNVENRDKLFKDILEDINDNNYRSKRASFLSLLYAGAKSDEKGDEYSNILLQHVVENSDVGVTKVLLELDADSHQCDDILGPIIFSAKIVEIAKLLIAKGADVYCIHDDRSVLNECLTRGYSLELMKFYIEECKVDATRISHGGSLWHVLIFTVYHKINKEKAKLLFRVIPTLINQKDKKDNTPLDYALNCCEENFISMLRQYGAKTSKELEEEERAKINA